jgi:APA family basic amino acid/polyamine antiporter
VALALQAALSLGMLFTASFEVMIESVGFVLSFWAGLAVLGVIVLRRREPTLPRPYKTLGYPVTPLVFVALMGWIIVRSVISKPEILVWGALALVASLAIWLWARPRDAR